MDFSKLQNIECRVEDGQLKYHGNNVSNTRNEIMDWNNYCCGLKSWQEHADETSTNSTSTISGGTMKQ